VLGHPERTAVQGISTAVQGVSPAVQGVSLAVQGVSPAVQGVCHGDTSRDISSHFSLMLPVTGQGSRVESRVESLR